MKFRELFYAYFTLPAFKKKKAFTMVEVMLVVIIVGMAAAVAIPQFIGSMRLARLRASARSVVMINRYARSMAILKQSRMVLQYDFERNKMTLGAVEGRPNSGQMRDIIDSAALFGDRSYGDGAEEGEANPEETAVAPPSGNELSRSLKEGVSFTDFVGVSHQSHENVNWINYYPNGMCDEHSFRLVDEFGKEAIVSVEPITGEVTLDLRE